MNQRQGIHKITESTDGATRTLNYRFIGQIEGRGYFAQIELREELPPTGQPVALSGQEFAWLKAAYGPNAWEWQDCDTFRQAATFGVHYALCNRPHPQQYANRSITILMIGANLADTTPETIAYVACFATWKLLNLEGVHAPYIAQHHICFPGQQPA